MNIIQKLKIKEISGFDELSKKSSNIYLVGGIVRDYFLNKESKDIDIIVCGLDYEHIVNILKNYGEILEVGKSFGILKYKPFNWIKEPIDIAIPRKDTKNGNKHQEFKVSVDPFLPIEKELERRDYTVNSIAVSWDGTIIDPFNGLEDIKNKKIRATSKTAFIEDYLRAIRGIQFSSRFDFEIESETLELIKQNRSDIKSISSERILEELEKIYYKGNIGYGIELLVSTGLYKEIFGCDCFLLDSITKKIKTKSDFYFLLCGSNLYKTNLKGDIKTEKGIKAIEHLIELSKSQYDDIFSVRKRFYEAIQISDSILESNIIPSVYSIFKSVQADFLSKKLPNSYKDLSINGDDLLAQGFKGVEIGQKLKEELYKELKNENI